MRKTNTYEGTRGIGKSPQLLLVVSPLEAMIQTFAVTATPTLTDK